MSCIIIIIIIIIIITPFLQQRERRELLSDLYTRINKVNETPINQSIKPNQSTNR